tara:strand:- start:261 stop:653 length:393 start_codon:yes stop_codon:yes gene_type:complete
MELKLIEVACAIICFQEKVLVVQRSPAMSLPLKWEFPGGKIETNETAEECIEREVFEELNIKIEIVKKLTSTIHRYPNILIQLNPFLTYYIGGEIILLEHVEYRLLENKKLIELDWADADIPILLEYLSL